MLTFHAGPAIFFSFRMAPHRIFDCQVLLNAGSGPLVAPSRAEHERDEIMAGPPHISRRAGRWAV